MLFLLRGAWETSLISNLIDHSTVTVTSNRKNWNTRKKVTVYFILQIKICGCVSGINNTLKELTNTHKQIVLYLIASKIVTLLVPMLCIDVITYFPSMERVKVIC